MTRVVGFGGIFFKSPDTEKLISWYKKHPGIEFDEWGGVSFRSGEVSPAGRDVYVVFSPFKDDTEYFSPSKTPFMFNFRVDDLDDLMEKLEQEGVDILPDRADEEGCGRFAWVIDPDGNKIELWEPPMK